ncbi:hypothetical protein [Magnetococcus sp. PR-3]|uniref:hypothetical protein n=1 Tax=Magnetococcus sp. PR-3 TaxID=3120355 RepID=UPI002FCE1DC6
MEHTQAYDDLIDQAQHGLEDLEHINTAPRTTCSLDDAPPENWVGMADYVLKGKRPPAKRAKPSLPDEPAPDRWVDMHTFALDGVRAPEKSVDERDFLPECLRNPPPPPEPPPEQSITVFDALAQVYQVTRMEESVVFRTLNQLSNSCQEELEQGQRDESSASQCQADLKAVSTRYAGKVEEICDWYMETYFRDIRNPGEIG